jgi:hypothetical protein
MKKGEQSEKSFHDQWSYGFDFLHVWAMRVMRSTVIMGRRRKGIGIADALQFGHEDEEEMEFGPFLGLNPANQP